MTVLIADHNFGLGGGEALGMLSTHGLEIVVNPFHRRLTPAELITFGNSCVGVVAGLEPYTSDILDRLPSLRCISRVGVGTDNIDLAVAQRRGIEVCTTHDAPTQAVAEFTFALMFCLLRGVPQMDRAVRQGKWERILGRELGGWQVGIIGLGRIGRAVAQLLRGLNMEVYACDIVSVVGWAAAHDVRIVDLETLMRSVDLASIHVPYSAQTRHLIDERLLRLMRPRAYLVNTSRGGVIDEEALYRALLDGHLAGAALDVFEVEPYSGPLRELDQVILTPHAATFTRQARERMEFEAVENLLSALGRAPSGVHALRMSETR